MWRRFSTGRQSVIPPMQTLLRGPRAGNHVRRRAALTRAERRTDEWAVSIMPRGFDQNSSQMRVAGLGDRAPGLFGATRMFGRHEADEGHRTGRGRKA